MGTLTFTSTFYGESAAISRSRMVDDVVAASFLGSIEPDVPALRSGGREGYLWSAPTLPGLVADIVLDCPEAERLWSPTGRKQPKDAYDVLLAVTRFVDGPRAAWKGSAEARRRIPALDLL